MDLSDFDFELPEERIALYPQKDRHSSKLMRIDRPSGEWQHSTFQSLPEFLRPGDLLIANDTRVIPARIYGTDSMGKVSEFLVLEEKSSQPVTWTCLVRNQRRAKKMEKYIFFDGAIGIVKDSGQELTLTFSELVKPDFLARLDAFGKTPLPPYIKRSAEDSDAATYQTIYANESGSVAAPTAGLHFSTLVMAELKKKDIGIDFVTLHVGLGTFTPIRGNLHEHTLHRERYCVPEKVWERIEVAKSEGRRIISVGTTSLRALESVATYGLAGQTNIFITPGFQFNVADGLITNFHLPKSSLIVLVSAFLGIEKVQECYLEAIRKNYRFFSYGDAMLIL